jgi:hypothetical protein
MERDIASPIPIPVSFVGPGEDGGYAIELQTRARVCATIWELEGK